MGSIESKIIFFTCFCCIFEAKNMSEIIYDEFLDKLGPEDLADDIFQTLLSTPPKTDREDLMQSDLSDSMNTSLSPCIVSSTCRTPSSTAINPLTLEKSPRGFGNNSVKESVQTKRKFQPWDPRRNILLLILKQKY